MKPTAGALNIAVPSSLQPRRASSSESIRRSPIVSPASGSAEPGDKQDRELVYRAQREGELRLVPGPGFMDEIRGAVGIYYWYIAPGGS